MTANDLVLNTNGGWCWYQDERVIVDSGNGKILFSSVATPGGAEGETRNGDIDVTCFDPATGDVSTVTMAKILTGGRGDDHNVAAIWQRPDGRYLVVYTGHNYGAGWHGDDTEPITFYRLSTHPHDATDWQPEQTFTWPRTDLVGEGRVAVTYSNLHYLTAEGSGQGRLYNIARAAGQVWQIATSDDLGETWTYRGALTRPPEGGRAYSNGYLKFSSNGVDRIDFIATEAHPRDYNNGVYHGYIQGGKTYNAAGEVIDPDTFAMEAPQPEAFTPLFEPAEVAEGTYHHGWTVELIRDGDGGLHALYLTRVGVETSPIQVTRKPALGDNDHRLFYARLAGDTWHSTELAHMGPGLYDTEEDYTGLGAIDPRDGKTVYVSTAFDPRDNSPLANRALFQGVTGDQGATWSWTPLTGDSGVDNLRPRLAVLDEQKAVLLWLRGHYHTMHTYDLKVMARDIVR